MGQQRAEGLLVIDDGYTLTGTAAAPGRPPLRIRYRPALPEAVYEYRIRAARAVTGAERLEAVVWVLEAHVESWDGVKRQVVGTATSPVPFKPGPAGHPTALRDPGVLRAVGIDYLEQLVNFVTGYSVGEWEEDRGNSPSSPASTSRTG